VVWADTTSTFARNLVGMAEAQSQPEQGHLLPSPIFRLGRLLSPWRTHDSRDKHAAKTSAPPPFGYELVRHRRHIMKVSASRAPVRPPSLPFVVAVRNRGARGGRVSLSRAPRESSCHQVPQLLAPASVLRAFLNDPAGANSPLTPNQGQTPHYGRLTKKTKKKPKSRLLFIHFSCHGPA